eukprot:771510-Amphidinium_carterae.1
MHLARLSQRGSRDCGHTYTRACGGKRPSVLCDMAAVASEKSGVEAAMACSVLLGVECATQEKSSAGTACQLQSEQKL